MKIRVATDDYEVKFALNDTSAAASLYRQFPLTIDVENYSNNEKGFMVLSPNTQGYTFLERLQKEWTISETFQERLRLRRWMKNKTRY